MRYVLKILNPFIWFINFFAWSAHAEGQRGFKEYTPYDFSRDLKYF